MCNNCNQKRLLYSSGNNQLQKGMVKVKLAKNTPMIINGNITGRKYVFKKINDLDWVDKRDVMGMKRKSELQIFY